jgi:hypothetical protein
VADKYVDKDGDNLYVWEGKSKDPKTLPSTQYDSDDTVKNEVATGTEPGAGFDAAAVANQPSVSVSAQGETTADINTAFQLAFGEDAPPEVAKAYYNAIRTMQSSRTSGGAVAGKTTVNTQGVSATESKALIEKFIAAAAADKINAAESGDPQAQAALQRGNMGIVYTKLKQAYADNGIPVNLKSLGKTVASTVANPDKLSAELNLVQLQAKTYFPALAEKIDAGYSVKQLLNPYLQTRANILEEDADTIDVKTFQSIAKDPKGLMNLYDYEVSLRNDPKWRFTKNAQDTMSGLANSIGKMFGVIG